MEGPAQPPGGQPRPKPGTPSLLRELNDRAALELLLADGPLTRAQLPERTGVSKVSVGPNGPDDPVGMGRDATSRACESGGIDLADLSAVVIGSPGVLDPRTGAPRLAVNLPPWHEGVLDGLRNALHTPVVIENDVNLAAMAERAPDGAAAGLDDFVLVWLGGCLGLATVIGGEVLRGSGGAAGEIGWMPVHGTLLPSGNEHPGKAGLQALAGGWAIQALATEHGFGAGPASDAVAAAVADIARGSTAAGGSRGAEFLDAVAHRVATGVAAGCVVLDPGLVVLGGPVGHAGADELAARGAIEVSRICLARPTVVPTPRNGEPVLRGAMQAALAQARAQLLGSLGLELSPGA